MLQGCLALSVGLAPTVAHAQRPRTRVRLMNASNPDDVSLMPGNLAAGLALAGDVANPGVSLGPSATGELVSGLWRRFAWTTAVLRIALYRPCGDCGWTGDAFAGTRVGVLLASDRKRRHRLTLSSGLGWGTVGRNGGGRDPTGHGFVAVPSLRYTYSGILGVEFAAMLPGYDTGGSYPAVATISLVGFPLLLATAGPFWRR